LLRATKGGKPTVAASYAKVNYLPKAEFEKFTLFPDRRYSC